MTSATNHGSWEEYLPDADTYFNPAFAPFIRNRSIRFCRRLSDGKDFNEVRDQIMPTDDIVTVSAVPYEHDPSKWIIVSVSTNGMCAWPGGRFLFTVEGHEGDLADLTGKLIDAGGAVTDAPYVPTVPYAVSRAQALVALFEAGILADVEALVASHPYEVLRIWWANAQQFERNNPYLNALAVELGLTDEQVDNLFITAETRV